MCLYFGLFFFSFNQKKELKGENNSSNPVTPVKIPDCPVPAALLEELLKPSTAVSKEPLKNLNSCLRQLKYDLLFSTILNNLKNVSKKPAARLKKKRILNSFPLIGTIFRTVGCSVSLTACLYSNEIGKELFTAN